MKLDLNTLFAVLSLINLAGLVFAIILYLTRQVFAGARLWIFGQAAIVVASASFGLRDITPPVIGIVLPNTIYLLAQLALTGSIWQFRFSRQMPRFFWLLLPVFALAMFFTLSNTINVRIIIFSTILGMLDWLTALLLFFKINKSLRLASYLLGSTFVIIGAVQLVRIPIALFGPIITGIHDQGPVNSIIYLISILSAFAMLFGYFLMSSVRYEKELREQEAAIQNKNQQLEALNRTRGLLMSVIAHDLRVPLVSASNYVQKFLLPPEVNLAEKQKALKILATTLTNASGLLEDLLEWADSQGSTASLPLETIPINEVIHQALELLGPIAAAKNLDLRIDATNLSIWADRHGLGTILRNLLSNAIKFSLPGSQIHVRVVAETSQTKIIIADQGIGIDALNLEILRQGNQVISTNGTNGEHGNGLGLLLCSNLMRRYGGQLLIDSIKGVGTTFTLNFPNSRPS